MDVNKEKKASARTAGAEPAEARAGGDFVGPDGLLVCGSCGKPKQYRIPPFPGRVEARLVPCPCDCDRRAEESRRAAAAELAREQRREEARRRCFRSNDFFRACTFADDDGKAPEETAPCRRFVETFDSSDPTGLLLWGDTGTGKTFAAACIANLAVDLGYSAVMTDIGTVVNALEASFERRASYLEDLLSADLLVVDDLGAQRDTSYMMEKVYEVVDGRYRSGRPMVVTTNFPYPRIHAARRGDPWERVFDRLRERCYPVEFKAVRRRVANGSAAIERMRLRLAGA